MTLGEKKLFISHRIREKSINAIDNRKICLKPARRELAHRIFYTTCELNPPCYVNYYLIHTIVRSPTLLVN